MATIYNTNQQDSDNQNNQTQPSTTSAPVNSFAPTNQPQGQASGPFSTQQNKPSNAPNIRSYIDANQTDIAGQVKDSASKNIGAAQDKFATLRDMFGNNQSAINERLNKAQELNQGVNLFNQPVQSAQEGQNNSPTLEAAPQPQFTNATNLTDITGNEQYMDIYSKGRDAYTGDIDQFRTDFTQQGDDLNRVFATANTDVQNFATEEGRFKLLQDLFGSSSPNYTLGQQRLDQALLQGSGDLRQHENALRNQFGALDRDVAGLESEYNEFIPAVQDRVSTLAGEIGTNLRNYEQDLGGALAKRVDDRTVADEQMLQDIQNRFDNKQLTGQDLRFLGIDPMGAGQMIVNDWDTLNQYLDKGVYNIDNVTIADDIARYNALRQLAGDQIGSEFQLQLPGEAQELDDLYNIRSTDPFATEYDNYVRRMDIFGVGDSRTDDNWRARADIYNQMDPNLNMQFIGAGGSNPRYSSSIGDFYGVQTPSLTHQVYNSIQDTEDLIRRVENGEIWNMMIGRDRNLDMVKQMLAHKYAQRDKDSLLGRMAQDYQDPIRDKTEGVDFDALGIDPLNPGNSLNIPGKVGSEDDTKTYPNK